MELLNIEFNENDPIYLQIYQTFISQMLSGYIKQGDKLPSIRKLASQLNISKSTVENAYERMLSEGYIISKAKSGYFCDLPEVKKNKKEMSNLSFVNPPISYRYDFSSRLMDYEQFDQKVWIRYTKEVLENGTLMAGYGHPQGELELREQLSLFLYQSRNLHAKAEQLLIGAGISPLLYFICSLFKNQTLTIGFLTPGFKQAMSVFEDCHHRVVVLDSLDKINDTLDFLYLTPASLNLNLKKRMELLKKLKEDNIYLIEDDLNGDLAYTSSPLSCMQSLYDEDFVFYLSSFSKLLLPSVRLAVLSIPNTFHYSLKHYNQTASKVEQQVFAMYLQDGHMARRIKRLKRQYLKKSELMQTILNHHFKEVLLIEPQLCFEIHDDFSKLKKDDIINFQKIDDTTLRLYFSGMTEPQIEEGLNYLIKRWKAS